jgi:Tfp pilus assembly protein PilF
LQLARIYLKENQVNDAEAELIPLKQTQMQSEAFHALLAEVLARQGRAVELLRDIPAGSRSSDVESQIRAFRGLSELELGHNANAEQMLNDAERLNPKGIWPKLGKARLLKLSDPDAADRKLDEALAIDPKDSGVLDAKGDLALFRHDKAEAMKYFGMALREDPANVRALLDRGNLHLSNKEFNQAEHDALAALRADATNPNAMFLQASIVTQKGDYVSANAMFTKLRDLMDELPPEVYLEAGITKYHLNQTEQAEAFLTRYVAHRQDSAEAYEMLGDLALKRGDPKRAVDMLARAVKLDPMNAPAATLLEKARAELKKS